MSSSLVLSYVLLFAGMSASPSKAGLLRTAPMMCPINDGNLIGVELFVKNAEMCYQHCERTEGCSFYRFYDSMSPPALEGSNDDVIEPSPSPKPSQCFMFRTCGREVVKATPDCALTRENTVEVKPFVKSEKECKLKCQKERECGYYKYFPKQSPSSYGPTVRSNSLLPDSLVPETTLDDPLSVSEDRSEFCYVLSSCSKRMVDQIECTLGRNNFLDVKFFVKAPEECETLCQATEGCRYFWWYPIGDSERPQFCYLYRQCAAKDQEPEVALVVGGRHPGHYFMTHEEHNDLIMRSDVCMVGGFSTSESNDNITKSLMARAGATAEFVPGSGVIFCGGRNHENEVHRDCLIYDTEKDKWRRHEKMNRVRDEASSATVGKTTFVIGGVGENTVEVLDDEKVGAGEGWEILDSAELPQVVARGCAVATDDNDIILVGGHDNSSTDSLSAGYRLKFDSGEGWAKIEDMNIPRRDHACIYVEFEDARGVLVTGGLGHNDEVLSSCEFYDLETGKWTLTSSLKQARTEHGMSLVYGIPTVIGGLSQSGFLSSLEQFDKSSASWNVPLERDWRTINHALNTPRYDHFVASIPVSKIQICDVDYV